MQLLLADLLEESPAYHVVVVEDDSVVDIAAVYLEQNLVATDNLEEESIAIGVLDTLQECPFEGVVAAYSDVENSADILEESPVHSV